MQMKLSEDEIPTKHMTNPQTVINAYSETILNSNRASVLSLIDSIRNENQIFKEQQQNIESQLKKLKKISESLLDENMQLRVLYNYRTKDISKLLNTITINTNQVISDYQHQQFLLKELNYGVLKQIKQLSKELQTISQNIMADQIQCNEVNDSKLKLQQEIINKIKVKLKSDLQRKSLNSKYQKQMQELQNTNEISNEVINLVIQNKQLELILQGHQGSLELYSNLQKDKTDWRIRLKDLKIENSKYRNEISNDQANQQRIIEDLRYKQERHEKMKNNLNQELKKLEKYQRMNQQFANQRQKIKDKIIQSKKKAKITQEKLDDLKYKKSEIIQKVKAAKVRMARIKQDSNWPELQI